MKKEIVSAFVLAAGGFNFNFTPPAFQRFLKKYFKIQSQTNSSRYFCSVPEPKKLQVIGIPANDADADKVRQIKNHSKFYHLINFSILGCEHRLIMPTNLQMYDLGWDCVSNEMASMVFSWQEAKGLIPGTINIFLDNLTYIEI